MSTYAFAIGQDIGWYATSEAPFAAVTQSRPGFFEQWLQSFKSSISYSDYKNSLNALADVRSEALSKDSSLDLIAKKKLDNASQFARKFLLGRPLSTPVPEIDVWTSGKIAMEWYKGPDRILTALLDDGRRLVYSALMGEERVAGVCFVESQWPREILDLIDKVLK